MPNHIKTSNHIKTCCVLHVWLLVGFACALHGCVHVNCRFLLHPNKWYQPQHNRPAPTHQYDLIKAGQHHVILNLGIRIYLYYLRWGPLWFYQESTTEDPLRLLKTGMACLWAPMVPPIYQKLDQLGANCPFNGLKSGVCQELLSICM